MGKKLRLAVFAGGLLVLGLLVWHVGLHTIARDSRRVGWWIVPVVLVYLPVYMLNAVAWRMTMGEARRPSYWRTLMLLISGFALNFLTPVLALGGEPYRVASLAPWLGRRRAVASVASYFLLHALANALTWLTALLLALAIAPWPRPLQTAAAVVALVLFGVMAVVFRGLRRGVFEDVLGLAMRVPLLRRLLRRAHARRAALARIDAHMAAFYKAGPTRFYAALGIEYAARILSMAEFWLILIGLRTHAGFAEAIVMGSMTSLVMNVVFFVPLEVGTKEGALYIIADTLGFAVGVGLMTSLITRVREVVWAGIGVAIVPLVGRGRSRRSVRA